MITSDRVAHLEREIERVLGSGWQINHMTLHDRGEPVRLDWMAECRLPVTFGPVVVESQPADAHGTWSAEGGIERCFLRLRLDSSIQVLPEAQGSTNDRTPPAEG